MKRWQVTAAIVLPLLISLLAASQARAQSFDGFVNQVAVITVKSGNLVDALLGYWVQGNDLTTQGSYLVGALAQTAVNTVHFLAQLITLF
jgi:hypothetical protein